MKRCCNELTMTLYTGPLATGPFTAFQSAVGVRWLTRDDTHQRALHALVSDYGKHLCSGLGGNL